MRNTLIAASGDEVIEYERLNSDQNFSPKWVVKKLIKTNAGGLIGLDLVGGTFLVFYKNGVVECQNLESGKFCGSWTLPMADRVIGSGCAYEKNGTSVNILVANGHQMQLMNA